MTFKSKQLMKRRGRASKMSLMISTRSARCMTWVIGLFLGILLIVDIECYMTSSSTTTMNPPSHLNTQIDLYQESRCLACIRNVTNILKIDGSRMCDGYFCGPYQISYTYWAAAGKPGTRQGSSRDFDRCARDHNCAEQTVRAYIKKFRRDCNSDNQFDCRDMAALHKAGPASCNADWFYKSRYWIAFNKTSCMQPEETSNRNQNFSDNMSPSASINIPMRNQSLTSDCLDCICEASGCNTNQASNCLGGSVCGPYGLSQTYWKDGKRPGASWTVCTRTRECSAIVVKNYMDKYKRDCNGDNVVTCEDYAAIHKVGPKQCIAKDFYQRSSYWNKFTACRSAQSNANRHESDINLVKLNSSPKLMSPKEPSIIQDNNMALDLLIKDDNNLKNLITNRPLSELSPATESTKSQPTNSFNPSGQSKYAQATTITPVPTTITTTITPVTNKSNISKLSTTSSLKTETTQIQPFIEIPSFVIEEMLDQKRPDQPSTENSNIDQHTPQSPSQSKIQPSSTIFEKPDQVIPQIGHLFGSPLQDKIVIEDPKPNLPHNFLPSTSDSRPIDQNIFHNPTTRQPPLQNIKEILHDHPIHIINKQIPDNTPNEDVNKDKNQERLEALNRTFTQITSTDSNQFILPDFPIIDEGNGSSRTNFNKVITDIVGTQAFSSSNSQPIPETDTMPNKGSNPISVLQILDNDPDPLSINEKPPRFLNSNQGKPFSSQSTSQSHNPPLLSRPNPSISNDLTSKNQDPVFVRSTVNKQVDSNLAIDNSTPQSVSLVQELLLAGQGNDTLNRVPSECLECICEASSNCDNSVQCISKQREKNRCGLYMISWNQFRESDILSTSSSISNMKGERPDDSTQEKIYIECATDKPCAERIINLYHDKHQKDCNNDGKIDCFDIAALHRVGYDNCASSKLTESQYWKDFNTCFMPDSTDVSSAASTITKQNSVVETSH